MIKPIETIYKGIKFRSKLEAQWAVFFDQCRVEWEYEPQGFDLGDGVWYLPDFLLRGVKFSGRKIDLWVEVKGVMSDKDAEKIEKFRKAGQPILVVGNIPRGETYIDLINYVRDEYGDRIEGHRWKFFCYETIDGDRWRVLPSITGLWDYDLELTTYDGDIDDIDWDTTAEYYYKARNYRFDHRNSEAK